MTYRANRPYPINAFKGIDKNLDVRRVTRRAL
ncbi:protein of unknown function [Shinella sp. WSC3-e]|nr:hypothetical protein SHINE37_42936 [Rhizobiaceae bacterium]CAK7257501.1 protein of unknown function [Shinella sp. WSC3-e]